MYYSAGTYEAFAHPEKPKDVDKKSAYIIGTGLAGLTAAFYLVRDGQMKGEHIHLLEKLDLAGGSCDGRKDVTKGFFMRGGREMDNHFEVMWDTFRDVPSIETPGVSVLDEYYWLNKHDPNYSLCRATVNRGEDAHTDKKFELDKDSALALSKLFLTPEKDLEDKKISDVLPDSFWSTNFWLYWQTMFAFQRWSSALEMKRYLCRYVHHIDGLPDFSALRFTKYNQYESMILPLVKYLESHGVRIEYGMDVRNVIIDTVGDKKVAKQIVYVKDGEEQTIDLIEDDLVFITNGCCTDTSCYGDQTHAPDLSGIKNGAGESWDMWKAIAAQAEHGEYGNPDNFWQPDIDREAILARLESGMKIREARPIRVIGKVKTPILFLHGRKDAFSLPKRAEELYAACNAPKELVWMDEGSHSHLRINNQELYDGSIKAFLQKTF